MLKRLLRPIVEVRDEEASIALLMFSYSFLAMTVWNILKPITRSKFISNLGADNLPYVTLVAGVAIGFIMQGYSKAIARVPRRWAIPVTQLGLIAILVAFWIAFQSGAAWAPPAFYFFGLIFSVLLISQFWTLANDIFDARQAKRIFGFIGGGSSLGGIMGSTLLQFAQRVGTNNLLLVSASLLSVCLVLVVYILRNRRDVELAGVTSTGEEAGLGGGEAFRLLRSSRHLQVIALVISFAATGAYVIEQQLNMAVEENVGARADVAAGQAAAAVKDRGGDQAAQEAAAKDARKHTTDDITQLLGRVQLYTSVLGFVVQVWLVSKIQRYLGVGFALLLLPVSMGMSASLILITGMLWSTQVARVLDTGLRYTVDKTTREILFLPLPTDLKYQAKPFVDVTMDRFAKGLGGVLTLLLIKPWGLGLTWRQLSFASLTLVAAWVLVAVIARRSYLRAIPDMFGVQALRPADVRIGGDRETIERVLMEMADPDEKRVLYAIDVLESLEKKNLVTPLLLYHESPKVRARALAAMAETRSEVVQRWQPKVEGMLSDPDTEVRIAALRALAAMKHAGADLVRPYLADKDPRIASAAALVLARSESEDDRREAESTLARLSADTSEAGAAVRRDVAAAVRQVPDTRFRHLLAQLLDDPDRSVAEEALASVRQLGTADFLFVPALVQLLRHRWLKGPARDVLVSYGEDVVDSLAYFLNDREENAWVRRHIPATLARIPSQKSMDALVGTLAGEKDGFLRYKLISAMDRLVREHPELSFDRKPVEAIALREGTRYFQCLSLHYNLFERESLDPNHLLARALREKMGRARSRVFLLLGLLHSPREVSAAQWAIERGDAKARGARPAGQHPAEHAHPQRRGVAARADQRRGPDGGGRGDPPRRTDANVVAGRRHRVRARAPRRPRLVRVRGGVMGVGRTPHACRTPPRAVARAATRRRVRFPPRRAAALRAHVGRRAVPPRRRQSAGAARARKDALHRGHDAVHRRVPARRRRDPHVEGGRCHHGGATCVARLRRGRAGRADGPDGAHDRELGDAGADRGGVPHAARQQYPPRAGSVRDDPRAPHVRAAACRRAR
jgi:AAA family ATP:ADP antiporter